MKTKIIILIIFCILIIGCSNTIIWKSQPKGDFAEDTRDPKLVCEQIQNENNLTNCQLKEYKYSMEDTECADGKSVAGCFACRFECR